MSTDYYRRFLHLGVQASCPGCGRTLRLHEFRKWWGNKRILRTLCRLCEPEKSLEDMTLEERSRALDEQRPYATPTRVAAVNARQVDVVRRRQVRGAKRRHSAARTQAWSPTLKALRDERVWCRKNLQGTPSLEWRTFFAAYDAALTDALRRAKEKKAATTSIKQVPLAQSFMYRDTLVSLSRLYGECPVIRGRRLYRDPACLGWLDEVKGEK